MKYPDIDEVESLTKEITPQYPLKYEEVGFIISKYLQECSMMGVEYSRDEIDKRIWEYYKRCY